MRKLTASLSLLLGVAVIVTGFALNTARVWRNLLAGIGLVIVVVSGVELIGLLLRKRPPAPPDEPSKVAPEYARKRSYITRSEHSLLLLLRQINPDRYEVIPQVALNSVIDKLTQNAYRNELFRVVDFLFVDAVSFAPLLLVELNDASHLKADRMERDRKVKEICDRAGMPLVTFTTSESKDFPLVKKTVLKNILRK